MKSLIFQHFEETIPAGEYRTVHAYSRMLTILSNTASDKIYVGLGEMQPVPLKAGLQYELPQGDNFRKIILYNQESSQTTVEFIVSFGTVRDNRLTLSGSVFNDILLELQAGTAAATYSEDTIGTSAVQIFAADADRKAATVWAKDSNAGKIYLGSDNTVTASKWFAELLPGRSVSIPGNEYRGPIYGIATAAGQLIGKAVFK